MPNLLNKLGQLTQRDCDGITLWVCPQDGESLTKEEIAFFDRDWLKAKAREYFKRKWIYSASSTRATYDKLFGPYKGT